jgi:hypothetical protein
MSTEMEAKLRATEEELAAAYERLAGRSNNVTNALNTMAGASGNFVGAMNSGAQGMNAYSGLVAAGGKALGQLAGDSNIARQSLGALAGASSSLITAIFKQSDALFKSYQDISQIGAAGSSGMQGVFDNMQKFGYSIEELPKFGALLAQNSEALAAFGGTVEQGTKQFANVAEGIQRSGLQTEFERMGMSVDSINKGTAAYLKTQTMTGASAAKSQAELTAGAAEYIRQQDILSKLTGKSAETLLKNEEARMADNRYNSVQSELQMKADAARDAGNEDAAKDFERQKLQNAALVERAPAGMKKGIQDLLTGFAQTKEAQAVSILNNKGAQQIQSGKFEAADVLESISQESKANRARTYALGKAGVMDDFGAQSVQAQTEAAAMGREGVLKPKEATAAAEATQKGQRETPEAAVANQVAIRQAQQEVTRGMNSMVQIGVHPATAALKSFSAGLEAVVTRMPGTGDKTGIRNTPGRGDVKGTGFQGKAIAPEIMQQNQGTINKFNTPGDAMRDMVKNMGLLENASPANFINSAARRSVDNSSMASIIDRTNQYTGPNSTLSSPVGNNTPTGPVTTPASSATTTDSSMLTTSMNELIKRATLQQNSLDELVDLSRRSLAQNGKLLQAARQ